MPFYSHFFFQLLSSRSQITSHLDLNSRLTKIRFPKKNFPITQFYLSSWGLEISIIDIHTQAIVWGWRYVGMHKGQYVYTCTSKCSQRQSIHRHTYKTISKTLNKILFTYDRIFVLENVTARQPTLKIYQRIQFLACSHVWSSSF